MSRLIKHFVALIAIFTLLMNASFASEIIAYVNDDVITSIDYDQNLNILSKSEGRAFNSKEAKAALLDEMIGNKLLIEFCKKQKLEVSHEDVDKTLERMAAQNNVTVEAFYEMLELQGINQQAFKDYLATKLTITSFDNTFILPKVEIKTKDININRSRVVDDIVKHSRHISRIDVSEIVVYKEQVGEEVFEQLLSKVPAELKKNGFEATAEVYSNSSSAASGGKVGWVKYSEMSPIYQTLLTDSLEQKLPKSFINELVLLILKANDVEYEYSVKKSDITDQQVEHYLKMEEVEKQRSEFIQKLRKKAYIDKR